MKVEITPEMLEAARKRREEAKHDAEIVDPGAEGICLSCE